MAWPTLPTAWAPLTKVAAADIALLLDAWAHLAADWDTDTPAVSADTSNPTGWTSWAYYKKVGSLLHVQEGFYGNGGTAGTGDYRLALAGSETVTGALADQTLVGGAYEAAAAHGVGRVYSRFVTSDDFEMEFVHHDGTRTVMSSTSSEPFVGTPSASDHAVVHGMIEVD